jgi:hypothetical protein
MPVAVGGKHAIGLMLVSTRAVASAGARLPAQTLTRGLASMLRNHCALLPKPEATMKVSGVG